MDAKKLDELTRCVLGLPPTPEKKEPTPDPRVARNVRLCLRILGSQLDTPASQGDEPLVCDQIRRQISSAASIVVEERASLVRFEELHRRLLALGSLRNRWAVLHLLSSLSRPADGSRDAVLPPPPATLFGGLSLRSPWLEAPQPRAAVGHASGSNALNAGAAVAAGAAEPRRTFSEPAPVVTERALLRDILYAFQGIDGRHIVYDAAAETFVVASGSAGMYPRWHDAALRLCELGWLFRRLAIYLRNNNATVGTEEGDGLVRQAFAAALQEELTDYYRLIALLEAQLTSPDAGPHPSAPDTPRLPGLSLLRLTVWAAEPLERMKLMAAIVDGVGHLRGGALASSLHLYTKHGDPQVMSFVQKLMGRVCEPLLAMVKRWIFEGVLQDPQKEFFVRRREAVPDDLMWQKRYYLDESMLPCFLSRALARQILVIGKSIDFMRLCCNDTEWVMGTMAAAAARNPAAAMLEYRSLDGLKAVAEQCAQLTNERVLWLMTERFGLRRHLLALKKFMLLGQGDFVTVLMDHLGPQLSNRGSGMYRHNLIGFVDSALRASNAQFEPADVQDRVEVRLLEAEDGDDGWRVFTLDYKLQSPVTAVIHAKATVCYRRMFQLLWSIKRAEWELSASWSEHMAAVHKAFAKLERRDPNLRAAFHRYSLVRGQMVFFASNLSNYMMFEVLETSWTQLVARLADAKDLEAAISAHDDYLRTIMEKALLGKEVAGSGGNSHAASPANTLILQLRAVLDGIADFCERLRRLLQAANIVLKADSEAAKTAEQRTRSGGWGYRANEEDDLPHVNAGDAASEVGTGRARAMLADRSLLEELDASARKYEAELTKLMAQLELSSRGSEILRYLTFRLDFNEYYKRSEDRKDSGSGDAIPLFLRM